MAVMRRFAAITALGPIFLYRELLARDSTVLRDDLVCPLQNCPLFELVPAQKKGVKHRRESQA